MTQLVETSPMSVVRSAAAQIDLCLPAGYQRRAPAGASSVDEFWTPERIRASADYQWHVYRWAAKLIRKHALKSVLDVGCGIGRKLREHITPLCDDVVGLDSAEAIRRASADGLGVSLHPVDLEEPSIKLERRFDLIICADVLEHLAHPEHTVELIKECATPQALIFLSTPDRDRLRGRDCRSSDKPDHVQEWSAPEFRRFLRSRGLQPLHWRLVPQTRLPVRRGLWPEGLYRAGIRKTSPLCCHAVLCRVAACGADGP